LSATNPVVKILLYLFLLIAAFSIDWLPFISFLLFLVLAMTIFLAPGSLRKGVIPVTIFVVFTFAGNVLFQEGEVICKLAGLDITVQGLQRGILLTVRLLTMIIGARLLTATTSSEDLLSGMRTLLGPAGRIGFVDDLLATISLSLRLLPVIYDEAANLYRDVMKSGASGLSARIRLSVSLLAPLFERSLKRARDINAGVNGNED
jgi:energy-coupling factor transport system permease protein